MQSDLCGHSRTGALCTKDAQEHALLIRQAMHAHTHADVFTQLTHLPVFAPSTDTAMTTRIQTLFGLDFRQTGLVKTDVRIRAIVLCHCIFSPDSGVY